MDRSNIEFIVGIPEKFRHDAALLYDSAFGAKFGVAVRSKERRIELLSESFRLQFGIAAVGEGTLLGVAGFHYGDGSLTGGMDYRRLVRVLGFLQGNWAAVVFSLYERKNKKGELLMDGISVRSDARGRGIGGRLLDEVESYAIGQSLKSIRLDVIDSNPDAKRLYERKGFAVTKSESFEWLRWFLGFGSSDTLVKALPTKPNKST
jgi:ribosomal protein S18 acetylase RimI-like enzyme